MNKPMTKVQVERLRDYYKIRLTKARNEEEYNHYWPLWCKYRNQANEYKEESTKT